MLLVTVAVAPPETPLSISAPTPPSNSFKLLPEKVLLVTVRVASL
jgi:hypothetical protein